MRKSDLQFILDTQDMKAVFYSPFHKTAQDGISGIVSKIKDSIAGKFDENNKVSSVLSFIGPGLLWVLGYKKIAIAYELAEALGFNWSHFFSSIKDKLSPLLTNMVNGKEHDSSDIKGIVDSSAEEASDGDPDPKALQELITKYSSAHIEHIIKLARPKGFGDEPGDLNVMKRFMDSLKMGDKLPLAKSRSTVVSWVSKIFYWILIVVLISCGFSVVGSLVSNLLGGTIGKLFHHDNKSESGASDVAPASSKSKEPEKTKAKLVLNPDADPKLFQTSYNDENHVWILNMNINHIEDTLVSWAQALYPQLTDASVIKGTSKFETVLSMFKDRNKMADQLEILAVPHPFQSIKQIVDSFAVEAAEKMPQAAPAASNSVQPIPNAITTAPNSSSQDI